MTFANTPDSAMFGEPMVYVQFISPTDEAGCSTSAAEVELALTADPNTGPLEPMTVDVVPSAVVDPGYWSAVVDLSEHVHGL